MNGEWAMNKFLKQFLKRSFALTDRGVHGALKAGMFSFLVFVITMCPAMLLLLLVDQLLLQHVHDTLTYVLFSLITLIVMAVLLSFEYESQYNETYKEAANLRTEIAQKLSQLEMSYFSKHDLADLAQSIMARARRQPRYSHSTWVLLVLTPYYNTDAYRQLENGAACYCANLGVVWADCAGEKLRTCAVQQTLRAPARKFASVSRAHRDVERNYRVQLNLYARLEDTQRVHWKSERNAAFLLMGSGIFGHFSLAFTIVGGIFLMQTGEISILYLIGYVLAAMKIKEVVDANMEFFMEIFYINSAVERINEIRNAKVLSGLDVSFSSFDMSIEHLNFSYDTNKPVLKDVSFTVPQGSVCALVGESGCGKTTLLHLIARLYDFDSGSISIGGVNIKDVSAESLYRNLSIVFQDVVLFNTSVLENIRIGREDADDEEVKRAARLAQCDFIDNLPEGFDTLIGENGRQLSGGERQRISIARAFLKNAPILILDEIASSLDVDNERKIQESLNELMKNKTVIIISHRMKSIQNAARIVVLKEGHVEACGTHSELLRS